MLDLTDTATRVIAIVGGALIPALPAAWREEIPDRLAEPRVGWGRPEAWQGTTTAGGQTTSAEEVGLHGWDLAVATGPPARFMVASVAGARARTASGFWN